MEQPKERAPWFTCVACQYRSTKSVGQTQDGDDKWSCIYHPPVAVLEEGMRIKWFRPPVTKNQYCGQFIDRKTGETYEERWSKYLETEND